MIQGVDKPTSGNSVISPCEVQIQKWGGGCMK